MNTILTFSADIANCKNLKGHKNEQIIRSGNRFEFSVYADELLVYNGNELIWNEFISMGKNKKFNLA